MYIHNVRNKIILDSSTEANIILQLDQTKHVLLKQSITMLYWLEKKKMCCYHSDHDYLKRSEVSSTNNTEYTKKNKKKNNLHPFWIVKKVCAICYMEKIQILNDRFFRNPSRSHAWNHRSWFMVSFYSFLPFLKGSHF